MYEFRDDSADRCRERGVGDQRKRHKPAAFTIEFLSLGDQLPLVGDEFAGFSELLFESKFWLLPSRRVSDISLSIFGALRIDPRDLFVNIELRAILAHRHGLRNVITPSAARISSSQMP
jgi:hypothetical protein